MSAVENYGKKGGCFLLFIGAIILFVILLIWVYGMNQNGLNL